MENVDIVSYNNDDDITAGNNSSYIDIANK